MNMDVSLTANTQQRQETFWTHMDCMVKQMTGEVIAKTLDIQMQEHLQADWNQRTDTRRGYRNGYYSRRLTTPHGVLDVKIPRCRNAPLDCSLIFDRYQRRIADVDRILLHTYLLGVSTRGTAELAEQIFGGSISHQTISKLTRWLDEQLIQWRSRPIEPVYKVVYIDGMHVDVVGGDRVVMLVSGGREDGGTDVLGFSVGRGERCVELLSDLRSRGLEDVEMFVRDESGSISHALEQVYPEVAWQSCTFHRLQALRMNVGSTDFRNMMVAEASCIFRCPSKRAAVDTAIEWARRWKPLSLWAVKAFMDGLTDSLSFYNLPSDWWKRSHTNNPMEGLIGTIRMRLDSMGCFHDEPAIERAVFGQLARWHKIKLTQDY